MDMLVFNFTLIFYMCMLVLIVFRKILSLEIKAIKGALILTCSTGSEAIDLITSIKAKTVKG